MTTVGSDRPRVVVVGPVNMDLFIRGEAPLDREALNLWVGTPDVELLVAGSIGYTLQVFAGSATPSRRARPSAVMRSARTSARNWRRPASTATG